MNLGQMMMVIIGLSLLGMMMLNANNTVIGTNDVQNMCEFGITAVSLATSIVEEASGKMYDEVISDSTTEILSDPNQLTAVNTLGKDGTENYRSALADFDDFDDFNSLRMLYVNTSDTLNLGSLSGIVLVKVRGLRARYGVQCRVQYVTDTDMDTPVNYRTWHKKLTIVVRSPNNPAMKDSLVYPTVMSYWN